MGIVIPRNYIENRQRLDALKASNRPGDSLYDDLQSFRASCPMYVAQDLEDSSLTALWFFMHLENQDFVAENIFYATPPVLRAKTSNKLLVVSNEFEALRIKKFLDTVGAERHFDEVYYCARDVDFWPYFFGETCFLDYTDEVDIPKTVMTTRHFPLIEGGNTEEGLLRKIIDPRERICDLTRQWDVETVFFN